MGYYARKNETYAEEMKSLQESLDELRQLMGRQVIIPDKDPYEEGAILRFDIKFNENSKVYHFVAVKTNDKWFTSSSKKEVLDWDQLVNKYLRNAEPNSVRQATLFDTPSWTVIDPE